MKKLDIYFQLFSLFVVYLSIDRFSIIPRISQDETRSTENIGVTGFIAVR